MITLNQECETITADLAKWVRVWSHGEHYRVRPDKVVVSGFQKVKIGELHAGDRVWFLVDGLGMAGIVK